MTMTYTYNQIKRRGPLGRIAIAPAIFVQHYRVARRYAGRCAAARCAVGLTWLVCRI